MESAAFIQWCIENLNYATITLLMAIESSFIPFPSEVVVPPAAYMAATGKEMNILLVVFFATVGANIGALINYYLAKWLGQPLVYRFANSRLGHLCLLNEDKIKNAEEYFKRHGAISTFAGRLVPAVRQLISIPAGLSGMSLPKFLLYTTLGAGIWNSILAYIGYSLSKIPGMEDRDLLLERVQEYSHEIGYIFLAIVVAAIAIIIFKAKKKKKQSV